MQINRMNYEMNYVKESSEKGTDTEITHVRINFIGCSKIIEKNNISQSNN